MLQGQDHKIAGIQSFSMVHFCSFEYFDGLLGKIKEKTDLYIDLKKRLIKSVSKDVLGNIEVRDFRISRYREDQNAWYFWIKNSLVGSKADSDEYFGLGVTKEGQDYWGQLQFSRYKPTFFKLKTQSLH